MASGYWRRNRRGIPSTRIYSPSDRKNKLATRSDHLDAGVTNVGAVYTVSVVPGGNTYFNQIDPITFQPIPGTDLNYSASSMFGYTGLVTIGSQAVPEPASIASGLAAMLIGPGVCGARRMRRRA